MALFLLVNSYRIIIQFCKNYIIFLRSEFNFTQIRANLPIFFYLAYTQRRWFIKFKINWCKILIKEICVLRTCKLYRFPESRWAWTWGCALHNVNISIRYRIEAENNSRQSDYVNICKFIRSLWWFSKVMINPWFLQP